MSLPWIRAYARDLDDVALQQMPAKDFRALYNLRLIAGQHEPRGVLPPIEHLAYRLRMSIKQTEALLARLEQAGFIERDGDVLMPRRWEVEQFVSDDVTERTRRHKEKKRAEAREIAQRERSGERRGNVPGNVQEEKRLDGEGDQSETRRNRARLGKRTIPQNGTGSDEDVAPSAPWVYDPGSVPTF